MMKVDVMKMNARLWTGLTGLLLVTTFTGCGGDNKFPVARVSGVVTYKGKPIAGGGTISFTPEGPGKAAGGMIGPDGKYTLTTFHEGDGALIGKHRVQIRQNTTLEPAVWPAVPEGQEPPRDFKPIKPEVKVPEADRIPAIYASNTSPLTANVETGKPNLPFDLQAK
jgi:hypothetical protein